MQNQITGRVNMKKKLIPLIAIILFFAFGAFTGCGDKEYGT